MIDSNEDGFSKANINAICSTGESTKTFSQGYIGEKGIGFKSVFKVARKVHVQSGPFSFAFKYQHGEEEDGLGMVTPMNEDPLDVPNGVRTRMILYLLEQCDRAKLYNEFASLPDTLLLFLKKLKQLSIKISLPGYSQVEQMYSLSSKDNRVSICKRIVNSKSSSTQDYRIIRHQVTNMPNDHARKGINEAEVVLAFPLDRDDVPVLENQHVFAFLPLRKLGFKVGFYIYFDISLMNITNIPYIYSSSFSRTLSRRQAVKTFLIPNGIIACWMKSQSHSYPVFEDF